MDALRSPAAGPAAGDGSPLDRFLSAYVTMKPPHWRDPAIESRIRAERRVLAMARGFHPGGRWGEAIDAYLAAYRLAVRAAASMPLFGARTTCWTVSSPEAVRKLSGSLAVSPRDLMRWEEETLWLRLAPESLQALRAAAASIGCSAPGLAAELIEQGLDQLPG
jgi:hypothetical protein